MAKPKKDVIVQVRIHNIIEVSCDNLALAEREIKSIEGVASIRNMPAVGCIHIWTNPRYDVQEIAQEIEELLTAKVPDIFKEKNEATNS